MQLEEAIYQQINLIKLKELNTAPLEAIRRILDKKNGKMIFDEQINEIGEGFNIDEIQFSLVNIVVPKLEEFGELPRRSTHFIRHRYLAVGCVTKFSFGFIPRKPHHLKRLALPN